MSAILPQHPGTSAGRVVSGMRPTGALHLGHYHGVLKNWVALQNRYECLFFVADWHALTTHYEAPEVLAGNVWEMVVDWLAAGVNPQAATLFLQSRVLEHAELHLLLSMITPLSWLERVPSYKDQQAALKERDLATYGFLGYPLLQSADILAYRADRVPVGEDQVAHVELTREIARRFNHLYGRQAGFVEQAEAAVVRLGENAGRYRELRRRYQEQGEHHVLDEVQGLLALQPALAAKDCERLRGYLEGTGELILSHPQALLTQIPWMPGLDGRKMSKSYGNTIALRETPQSVEKKIRTMPTDPARVRRSDPGEPEKCPVWGWHKVYSDEQTKTWVQQGCRSASIGCIECKQPVIDAVLAELEPIRERAAEYQTDHAMVQGIIQAGCEHARDLARDTLADVRQAMGLAYA